MINNNTSGKCDLNENHKDLEKRIEQLEIDVKELFKTIHKIQNKTAVYGPIKK